MAKKKMDMEDNEYKARKSVIEAMRDMAKAEMGGKLSGLKKVTVAADSKEDLKMGLDKAKELVNKTPNGMEEESEEECPVCGMSECKCEPEDESEEDESEEETAFANMSPEELDKQLKMLMAMKAKMQG